MTATLLLAALVAAPSTSLPTAPAGDGVPTTVVRRAPALGGGAVLHGAGLGPGGLFIQHASQVAAGGGIAFGSGCVPLVNGAFYNDFYAWTTTSSPAPAPMGSVTLQSGVAVLAEGNSFLTTLSQSFCVPPNATELRFDLVSTAFDTSAAFIPDAFEVSLLDAQLQSAVPTWDPGATSFFNVQESGAMLFGSNVAVSGATVTLDLTNVAPGQELLLTFDLIGADADSASVVQVDEIFVDDDRPGVRYCEGITCPCGNDSPGTGCLNSFGRGATLDARGTTSISADDLVLEARDMTASFVLLFGGTVETCVPTGDGLVGLQPGVLPIDLLRLGVEQASQNGSVDYGPGIVATVDAAAGAAGTVVAGSSWSFQVAYRDAPVSPCGALFNYTNPIRVTFTN